MIYVKLPDGKEGYALTNDGYWQLFILNHTEKCWDCSFRRIGALKDKPTIIQRRNCVGFKL